MKVIKEPQAFLLYRHNFLVGSGQLSFIFIYTTVHQNAVKSVLKLRFVIESSNLRVTEIFYSSSILKEVQLKK